MSLSRKTPMKQGAAMKSSGFAKAGKPRKEMRRKSQMKSKGPRMTPIRKAARGQDCTLRIPGVCNGNPETVVLCHSNRLSDGKGMGLKAPDISGCFGCHACHAVLDGAAPRPDGISYEMLQTGFDAAVARTHEILRKKGLIE